MTANAFILAAIWKTPSLRTPSYVLLAGLAFTDFFTGLITQPSFAVFRFVGVKTGDGKMYCDAGLVADGFGYYFSSLSAVVITMITVERWLHHEPKISSYSASSRYSLHHVCSFPNFSSSLALVHSFLAREELSLSLGVSGCHA